MKNGNEKTETEKEVMFVLTPEGQLKYWREVFQNTGAAKTRMFALKGMMRAFEQMKGGAKC